MMFDFSWLIFIPVLIIHELGHYIMYLLNGYKPSVKFHWWGVEIGNDIFYKLNPSELFIVTFSGVMFGFFPLLFFGSYEFFLIYLVMCSIDITTMINMFSLGLDKKDTVGLLLKKHMEEKGW